MSRKSVRPRYLTGSGGDARTLFRDLTENCWERHERRFQYFKLAFSFSVFAGGVSLMFLNHEYTGLIIAGGGIAAVAEKYAEKIVDKILSKLLGD
jgi:hypothetical protein